MSAYSGIYSDMQGLAELRTQSKRAPDAALSEVAGHFEALFTSMMLKTMRESSLNSDLFNSNQSSHYTEMFDNQVAVEMSRGRGLGLKEALIRQLGGDVELNIQRTEAPVRNYPRAPQSKQDFVNGMMPFAIEVERELGISRKAVVAQAALESGWGKHTMQRPDGSDAYNFFGIKADASWQGDKVAMKTLEFSEGVGSRVTEKFRAYDSLGQSVRDYADFIRRNPRYREAIERGADPHQYATELQRAGYATDPNYADKIKQIVDSKALREAA
ncbi:MAG: glucosaminidase domain-containing protein [Gammaproteobacteria bacterium]|nr:glucosaminidase domain-containing protein [Gammaproteobacteria bacterium]NNF66375.1 flagellar assembly peptidoglycan hydrolase FlgJ [Gammaproteobacteria bacterium]